MAVDGFTIIITTYNRMHLVSRAIDSALNQDWNGSCEIIVVDDASTDETSRVITENYPEVRYLRLQENSGPGQARMLGLSEAIYPFGVILDDDDTLLPDALTTMNNYMSMVVNIGDYPVFNFACSNGSLTDEYIVLTPTHYLNGSIRGDFVPVFNVKVWLEQGYQYPNLRVGGEGVLWMTIADRVGIPSWNVKVQQTHDDAPNRLTSFAGQIHRAREYAELQDLYLSKHNSVLRNHSPRALLKKQYGASVYWLLAGERQMARARLIPTYKGKYMVVSMGLWVLSFLPATWIRRLFLYYRA